MDIQDKLENIIVTTECGRRLGKTTELAKVAKALNGYFVCDSPQHAKLVLAEHDVKVLLSFENMRGMTGPFIWDHMAVARAASQAKNEIDKLRLTLKKERIYRETIFAAYYRRERGQVQLIRELRTLKGFIKHLFKGEK